MDKKITQPDGSLHSLGDPAYIKWKLGDKYITLDGDFTIEDLSWLVSHMKSVGGINHA